jgi:rare lipoprotein A (peptidoglycan hydrolase)
VVAGDRSVTVKLVDWCQCYGVRLVDLSDDDFAVLAPLAAGVVRVRIAIVLPPATDTP